MKNKIKLIPQKSVKQFSKCCSRRKEGDELKNWNNTLLEIYNFIRALVPHGPYVQSLIKDNRVFIHEA